MGHKESDMTEGQTIEIKVRELQIFTPPRKVFHSPSFPPFQILCLFQTPQEPLMLAYKLDVCEDYQNMRSLCNQHMQITRWDTKNRFLKV